LGKKNLDEPRILYTEYHRCGTIFRAHPNYRSMGPWNDWVTVQFERYPRSKEQDKKEAELCRVGFGTADEDYDSNFYVPGMLFGFFEGKGEDGWAGKTFALIKFLESSSLKKNSVLTYSWRISEEAEKFKYAIVDVEQFVRHSLIVQTDDTFQNFVEVLPSELWADQFHEDD
jgi:hypothetical protein